LGHRWDIIGPLHESGFDRAEALLYYSVELGYIGRGEQLLLAAFKQAPNG
jgi:hypothetical protein